MESKVEAWVRPSAIEYPALVKTIRLERLELRHAADLFAVADMELFRHTAQGPTEWSVRGFEEEMKKVLAIADSVAFAIVHRETGKAIGRTTYMEIKPDYRGIEIGRTWIGRKYHGTRVNPEVKYLMLRHVFEMMSPPAIRMQITTSGTNLHSQTAIAKLGAVKEGVLRKSRIAAPTFDRPEAVIRDHVYYSILDDEWPAVKAKLEARLK